MRVEVRGETVRCLVDGAKVFEFADCHAPRGQVGLNAWSKGVRFRNIKVSAPDGKALWTGLPDVPKESNVPAAGEGFVPLFNGKDLTGWVVNGDPACWKVVDGVIEGARSTFGPVGLMTTRTFGDFHLRMETSIAEGNNSFIQFRQGVTGWYIVHIDGTTALPGQHTGDLGFSTKGLTAPTPLAQADPVVPLKPGKWFTVEIIAKGAKLTVLVKGKAVATFEDPERRFSSGVINLVCRGNSKVKFRKIEIKELPHD